ncbi:255_t:CDS:2 [Ambispora gerdemannii]|uniref:255_t:CDS:1 n=1 Tax=Ambispora gerdemannii TaxID=144530 RepID=A0A9N9FU84_9GLOM|nr:255_t:CDS:2 [Ambispora gerdemannii]
MVAYVLRISHFHQSSNTKVKSMLLMRSRYSSITLQAFMVLACGHIHHHTCIENHIVRTEAKCPACSIIIETIREEVYKRLKLSSAGGSDNESARRKLSPQSMIIVGDNNDKDVELMRNLGLVDNASFAGQEKQTNQTTSDKEKNPTITTTTTTQDRSTSPIATEKMKSPMLKPDPPENHHHKSTFLPKTTKAEKRATFAYQDEIRCWYHFAEKFEQNFKDIMDNDSAKHLDYVVIPLLWK